MNTNEFVEAVDEMNQSGVFYPETLIYIDDCLIGAAVVDTRGYLHTKLHVWKDVGDADWDAKLTFVRSGVAYKYDLVVFLNKSFQTIPKTDDVRVLGCSDLFDARTFEEDKDVEVPTPGAVALSRVENMENPMVLTYHPTAVDAASIGVMKIGFEAGAIPIVDGVSIGICSRKDGARFIRLPEPIISKHKMHATYEFDEQELGRPISGSPVFSRTSAGVLKVCGTVQGLVSVGHDFHRKSYLVISYAPKINACFDAGLTHSVESDGIRTYHSDPNDLLVAMMNHQRARLHTVDNYFFSTDFTVNELGIPTLVSFEHRMPAVAGSKKQLKKEGIERARKRKSKAGATEGMTKTVCIDVLVHYEGRTFWEERWVEINIKDLHFIEELDDRDTFRGEEAYAPDDDDFVIGQEEAYYERMAERDVDADFGGPNVYLKRSSEYSTYAAINATPADYQHRGPKHVYRAYSPKPQEQIDGLIVPLTDEFEKHLVGSKLAASFKVKVRGNMLYDVPPPIFESIMTANFPHSVLAEPVYRFIMNCQMRDSITGREYTTIQKMAKYEQYRDSNHGQARVVHPNLRSIDALWVEAYPDDTLQTTARIRVVGNRVLKFEVPLGANATWFNDLNKHVSVMVDYYKYQDDVNRVESLKTDILSAARSIVMSLFISRNPVNFVGDAQEAIRFLNNYKKEMNKFYSLNRGAKYNIDLKALDSQLNNFMNPASMVELNKLRFDRPKFFSPIFDQIGTAKTHKQSFKPVSDRVLALRRLKPEFEEMKLPSEVDGLTVLESFNNNFNLYDPTNVRGDAFYAKFYEIGQEQLDKHGDIPDPADQLHDLRILKMRAALTALAFDPAASSGVMYSKLRNTKGAMMEVYPTTVVNDVVELLSLISHIDLEALTDEDYIEILKSGVIHPYKATVKEEFNGRKKWTNRRMRMVLIAPFNNLIATQMMAGRFLENLKHDVNTSGIAVGYGHTKEMLAEVVNGFSPDDETVTDDIEGMERSIKKRDYETFYTLPLLMMNNPKPATVLCMKNLAYMSARKYVEVDGKLLLQRREAMGHTVSGGLETTGLNSVTRNAAGRAIGDVKIRNTGDDAISKPAVIGENFEEDRKAAFAAIGFKVKEISVRRGEFRYCSAIVQHDGSYRWESCKKAFANLQQDYSDKKAEEFHAMYSNALDYQEITGNVNIQL